MDPAKASAISELKRVVACKEEQITALQAVFILRPAGV